MTDARLLPHLPMACAEAVERLSAFIDRELPAMECAALSAHLEACPACARAAREAKELRSLLRDGAPSVGRPTSLHPGLLLLEARRRRHEETRRIALLQRVAVLAAALLLVSSALIGRDLLARSPRPQAHSAVQAVTSPDPSLESFFDDESAILMVLSR